MILQRYKLITNIQQSRKKINRFLDKMTFRSLCFLVIGCLVIGELILAFSAPPTQWKVADNLDQPLDPQEIRRIRYEYSVATGQTIQLNITTTLPSIVKLIPVVFGEGEIKYLDPSPFISSETSHHLFKLPQARSFTVYRLFIVNPHDKPLSYEGYIINTGMNLDLLWVPLLLVFLYCIMILGQMGIQKPLTFLIRNKKKNSVGSFISSLFFRLKALLELEKHESGLFRMILIPIILWVIIRPMITIRIYYPGTPAWYFVLRTTERYLISSLGIGLMLLAILIVLDTIENIVGKKIRGDIMYTLSLPVKRGEWVFSSLIWPFYRYGFIFSLIFLIKAFVISIQIKLVFPWLSLFSWLLFFLMSFLTWISLGILISLTSKERIGALMKGILLLFFSLFSIHYYGVGYLEYFGEYGILFSLEGLAYSSWYRFETFTFRYPTDALPLIVKGNIVYSLPDVEALLNYTFLTSIWLFFLIFLIIIVIKKRSVN